MDAFTVGDVEEVDAIAEQDDQILDAALGCFGRCGYRHTSVEKIADAAHVSRPTVYQHFTGKEDLFRAVGARMLDAALADAEAASTRDAPLADRLHGVLNAKFGLVVGHAEQESAASCWLRRPPSPATCSARSTSASHQRIAAVVTDLLAEATDDLDLADLDLPAADAALLLLDAVVGIEQGNAPADVLHRRLRQLVELTIRGLTRKERTS